jgi:hypothetical protein
MDEATDLERECRILTAYVLGQEPSVDVVRAYRRAHDVPSGRRLQPSSALDRALLAVATAGPGLARAADAYAGMFARTSALRSKMVLLVAILESGPQGSAAFDELTSRSLSGLALRFVVRAFMWVVRLIVGALAVGPVCLWYRIRRGPSRA